MFPDGFRHVAAIAETRVSLRVWGDPLDPDELTAMLGRSPDHSHLVGEPNGRSGILWRSSMWSIESGEASRGDVDEKLNALLDSVNTDPAIWATLTSRFDADVFAGLFMDADNEGLTIEPRTMQRLGQLGLALHFDIYAPGSETD